MTAPAVQERRRHARLTLNGTALLMAGDYAQRARIANLSEAGMLAVTMVTVPVRLLGRSVDIELRLDANEGRWMRAGGRVIRIAAERVAIAFDIVPPAVIRMVDEMRAASRLRGRSFSVVLIDEMPTRRSAMAAGFRAAGCGVIEAATSLDAIVRLGSSSFEPDLIAVADSAAAEGMREFVERNHPTVKLVAIGDSVAKPEELALWLSSADPDSDLAARILELLAMPRRP